MQQPGRTAYRGFDYQIWVSMWLSLVFLIEEKLAQEVELEPLGGEDLALLQSGDADGDTSEIATSLHATCGEPAGAAPGSERAKRATQPLRRYIVQIKGREFGHWTPGALHQILTGSNDEATQRRWPIEVMKEEEDLGLLFVTDSTLSNGLGWFRVGTPAFSRRTEPRPANAAATWMEALSAIRDDVLTRFGVLQGQRYDGLEAKIDAILASKLNVPHSKRVPLREALHQRFRAAMLSKDDARVTVADIRRLAEQHDGLPGGPDPFVQPDNWPDIQRVMREHNAIVIIGEPGTGKSFAADRIVYEHRIMAEPFRVVRPEKPRQLRALSEEKEPLIVYVEDPFGYYVPDKDDDDWLRALDGFCSALRNDLKLVVTSRTAFAAQYLDDEKSAPRLRRHRFSFGTKILNRRRLLREYVAKEPRMREGPDAWLLCHEDKIVAALDRPLSYSMFVPRAADLVPEQRTDARLETLLEESSIAELGKDLEKTFEQQPDAVRAGLVAVWIVLEAWSFRHGAQEQLAFLEEALLERGAEVSQARTKLVEHRWLRVRDERLRMHPVYMEACLHVLAKRKALTGGIVGDILRAYFGANRPADVEAVFSVVVARDLVPATAKREVAMFASGCLRTSATRGAAAFTSALTVMAASGEEDDPLAMLARAVTQSFVSEKRRDLLAFEGWIPPAWASDPGAVRKVAEHRDTPAIVKALVRSGFPTIVDMWHPGAERLVDLLYDLVDVSAEFDSLVDRIDQFGTYLVEVVAYGAARSRTADPARLLERAIAEQRAYVEWEAEHSSHNEDSSVERGHLEDIAYERSIPARAIVDALLTAEAKNGNPAWAATQTEPLVFERFAERVRSTEEWNLDVIRRVFDACPTEMRASIVKAIPSESRSIQLVLELLPELPSHHWPDVLEACRAFGCGAETQADSARAFAVLKVPTRTLPPWERVALVYDLRKIRDLEVLAHAISENFGDHERAALSALFAEPGADALRGLPLLIEIACSKFSASDAALVVLAHAGYPQDDLIDASLASNSGAERAVAALNATTLDPPARRLCRIRRALRHQSAAVRTHALTCLHGIHGRAAIRAIICMVEDVTYSVRIAAAKALAGRSEPAAWQTLAAMLSDSADTSEAAVDGYGPGEDAEPEYGVSTAAAHALAALEPWPVELREALRVFVASRSSTRGAVSRVLRDRLDAAG